MPVVVLGGGRDPNMGMETDYRPKPAPAEIFVPARWMIYPARSFRFAGSRTERPSPGRVPPW